jgi:hypothetical protein
MKNMVAVCRQVPPKSSVTARTVRVPAERVPARAARVRQFAAEIESDAAHAGPRPGEPRHDDDDWDPKIGYRTDAPGSRGVVHVRPPGRGRDPAALQGNRSLGGAHQPHQYTRHARIGLVPAQRPADVLARLGWQGAVNSRSTADITAVLRSWEDRFGARLLEVGLADIRLLVSRPPRTLEAALPIAAEHFAFSEEAHGGLRCIDAIARAMVGNPFWDFWWD